MRVFDLNFCLINKQTADIIFFLLNHLVGSFLTTFCAVGNIFGWNKTQSAVFKVQFPKSVALNQINYHPIMELETLPAQVNNAFKLYAVDLITGNVIN